VLPHINLGKPIVQIVALNYRGVIMVLQQLQLQQTLNGVKAVETLLNLIVVFVEVVVLK
jgi:hypothetical protein